MKRFVHTFLSFFLTVVLLVFSFTSCSSSTVLLTVDGNALTEEAMNYYVYISSSMLELYYEGALDYSSPIEEFDGQSLGDVVKKLAYEQIVADYSAIMLAREHNLLFTEEEEAAVFEQIEQVIGNIGSRSDYTRFLTTVKTSDKTYRQMVYNQLLRKKVETYLVADDGPLALTEQDIQSATEKYSEQFVNCEYILISNRDAESGEELDSTTIASKKEEAKKVRSLAVNGTDFHKLMDRYSSAKVDGYSAYVEKSDPDIPSEFISAAFDLKEGDLSPVIVTQYGFYVIKRLPFDDYFSTVVLQNARQDKFNTALQEAQNRISVVSSSAYDRYTVK